MDQSDQRYETRRRLRWYCGKDDRFYRQWQRLPNEINMMKRRKSPEPCGNPNCSKKLPKFKHKTRYFAQGIAVCSVCHDHWVRYGVDWPDRSSTKAQDHWSRVKYDRCRAKQMVKFDQEDEDELFSDKN